MSLTEFLGRLAGDRARNRRTLPLVLGDWIARWTIAVPVMIWSSGTGNIRHCSRNPGTDVSGCCIA